MRMARFAASVVVLVLPAMAGPAVAATYNCLPVEIREAANHVGVSCAEPSGWEGGYPKDGSTSISRFAVSKADADNARRFTYLMQTALTAGIVVRFEYTSGDTSGASFGCEAVNCRKPWAFGLLTPATDVRVPYAVWPDAGAVSIGQGQWRHYGPFSISSFRKLAVTMTGTGNADLYVRRDAPPTVTSFMCRPQASSSTENCIIPGPDATVERAVTYHVAVRGVGASNTFTLGVSIQSK